LKEKIAEIKKYISELKIPGINQGLKMKIEEAYKLDKSYEDFLLDIFAEAHVVRKETAGKTE